MISCCGFPERTRDAQVHPSSDLRVAASLANESGEVLEIQRLKRRKDALRDAHDAPLEERALSRSSVAWTRGCSNAVWTRPRALGGRRDRRCSKTRATWRKSVRRGLWRPGIRRVLAELERGGRDLQAALSKARLNLLLEAYKEAKCRCATPKSCREVAGAVTQAAGESNGLAALIERRKRLRDKPRLTRAAEALGPIAQRNALRESSRCSHGCQRLAHDARERRERAQRCWTRPKHERARLERRRGEEARAAVLSSSSGELAWA